MTSGEKVCALGDLPVFDEWEDADYGVDFDSLAAELFSRPYQGLLRGSDGSAVFYRNADVRAITVTKESTHQTVVEVAEYYRGLAGRDLEGLLSFFRQHLGFRCPPEHLPNKQLSSRRLTRNSVARWTSDAADAIRAQIERVADGSKIDFIEDFARPAVVDFSGSVVWSDARRVRGGV